MVKFAETHATMCLFINNSTNNRHLKEVHCYLCCILKIYLKLFIINDLKCEMETEYAKKLILMLMQMQQYWRKLKKLYEARYCVLL